MKKTFIKNILLLIFVFLLSIIIPTGKENTTIFTVSNDKYLGQVQLGGDTIGIQIKTKVEIVGKYEVVVDNEKIKPWENSNILNGDYIYSINDIIINSNKDVNDIINNTKDKELKLRIIRNNKDIITYINVIKKSDGRNSIGLYIKDHITGIGTLTFVNKETNKYGALGHNINDALSKGLLYDSSIKGIKKAVKGIPGEKYATLSANNIGTIDENINIGIFGSYNKETNNEIVNVIKSDFVKKGKAQIVTVISGNIIKKYDIEIVEVDKQSSTNIKGIKFKVIDKELLQETGGIIQGMSGSPIIQDGNLIGAVSHVVVNDPSYGFGVFAEWMYYKTL